MSFSSETKKEMASASADRKCCMLAEISALLRFAGKIKIDNTGMGVILSTESADAARVFVKLIKAYFKTELTLSLGEPTPISRGRRYELYISPENNAEAILREAGILSISEGSDYITDRINTDIIKKKCCKRAFLRGAFLASGFISNPAKGYHLEIISTTQNIAEDLKKLMDSLELGAKIVKRRNRHIVYIKESEKIGDFLGLTGASGHLFKLRDVQIMKEMLNRANRITNCENANTERSVEAAQRQIAAIKKIYGNSAQELLPEKLRETAQLRLKNPEMSLAELAEMSDPPLKKSGISHRLRKICDIADKLQAE